MGYGKQLWFPQGDPTWLGNLSLWEGLVLDFFFSLIKEKQGWEFNQRQVAKTQKTAQMAFISNILNRPEEVKGGTFSLILCMIFFYLFFVHQIHPLPFQHLLKIKKAIYDWSHTAFKKKKRKKETHTLSPQAWNLSLKWILKK